MFFYFKTIKDNVSNGFSRNRNNISNAISLIQLKIKITLRVDQGIVRNRSITREEGKHVDDTRT